MTPAQFIANEVPLFEHGQIIVVSGPDIVEIYDLLFDARDAIILGGDNCLDPIDTRMTLSYPAHVIASDPVPTTTVFKISNIVRCFSDPVGLTITMKSGPNIGLTRTILAFSEARGLLTVSVAFPVPPLVGDGLVISPPDERAYKFEYLVVQNRASGATPNVILVGNQFDRLDSIQNPDPVSVDVDVVRDLFRTINLINVPESGSKLWGSGVRELFQYMSKVYHYDTRADDIVFVKDQIPER